MTRGILQTGLQLAPCKHGTYETPPYAESKDFPWNGNRPPTHSLQPNDDVFCHRKRKQVGASRFADGDEVSRCAQSYFDAAAAGLPK
jgi:hypothetical protein